MPVGPPTLPRGLKITFEMEKLLSALLEPKLHDGSGGHGQVGFYGMGGIGKTGEGIIASLRPLLCATSSLAATGVCGSSRVFSSPCKCKLTEEVSIHDPPTPQPPTPRVCTSARTVISNWLIRRPEVRRTFRKIVWATLGMTPNLLKCQALLYLQLTGLEMSKESSSVEAKQLLKHAFEGQHVLLVIDDCWELEHSTALNFVDDATPSKVLMSSRVRETLEGGAIVELGLPSVDDALQMLLKEAGLDEIHPSLAPPEALAVVEFCNK